MRKLIFAALILISLLMIYRDRPVPRTTTPQPVETAASEEAVGAALDAVAAKPLPPERTAEIKQLTKNKAAFTLVKRNPDGTLILRKGGDQITVLPDGRVLYLPESI